MTLAKQTIPVKNNVFSISTPLKRFRELKHKPSGVFPEPVINTDIHIVLELYAQSQTVIGQEMPSPQLFQGREDRPSADPCRTTNPAMKMLAQLRLCDHLVAVHVATRIIAPHPAAAASQLLPQHPRRLATEELPVDIRRQDASPS